MPPIAILVDSIVPDLRSAWITKRVLIVAIWESSENGPAIRVLVEIIVAGAVLVPTVVPRIRGVGKRLCIAVIAVGRCWI
jgi:hypothetical protein